MARRLITQRTAGCVPSSSPRSHSHGHSVAAVYGWYGGHGRCAEQTYVTDSACWLSWPPPAETIGPCGESRLPYIAAHTPLVSPF